MGNYTAFRCKALIKPEYHALVQALLDAHADKSPKGTCNSTSPWLRLPELAQTYPFLAELAACERGGSIFSWYLGDSEMHDWYPDDEDWQLSFKNGLLVFQSCIKNYDSEYTKLAKVLDIIAERIDYCAKWYEEVYNGPETYVKGKWVRAPEPEDDGRYPW